MNSVVTIGNFDGVHLGHQAIVQQVVALAQQHNLQSTIVVFEPQPMEFFHGDQAPARLTNLAEKQYYFDNFNIDNVVVLEFNEQLKNLSADEFVQTILLDQLQTQHLIVGDDFKFGADRQGDFDFLQQYSEFSTSATTTIEADGLRVSSSRIRSALAHSDFAQAKLLLGRAYTMRGEVIQGDQNGRKLNAPTANIDPQRLVLPLTGVFVVQVHGQDEHYYGVANLGTRPTVDGVRKLLETHIFDFDQDIYGQSIEIEFLHKLRDEQRFADLAELQQQIAIDQQQARDWLG